MRTPRGWLRGFWAEVRIGLQQKELERAHELQQEGEFNEARRVLERLLRRYPDYAPAQLLLSRLASAPYVDRAMELTREGRPADAESVLYEAVVRFPDDPEPHLWLGSLLVDQERFGVAAQHARRAAELRPDDPKILFRAAGSLSFADPEIARDYVERVKRMTGPQKAKLAFPYVAELVALDGRLTFNEGDHVRGIALLERAFSQAPDAVGIGGDLAHGYLVLGRTSDAAETIRTALQYLPDDDRLLRLRAQMDASST